MYGTMASVLRGIDPAYEDYIVSGIMIHSPQPLLFTAVKGKGCFVEDLKTGVRTRLQKSAPSVINKQSMIDLDANWPPYKKLLETYKPEFPNMACRHFSAAARVALFLNNTIDFGIEFTRKQNLEWGAAFGLIQEAGGVLTTADGQNINNEKFRTFAPDKIPLVIAPTEDSARLISQRLNLGLVTGV